MKDSFRGNTDTDIEVMTLYPFGPSKKKRNKQLLGIAAVAALFLYGGQRVISNPAPNISSLRITYYNKSTNQVTEANVANGGTYHGSAMGIQLRFRDDSNNGSVVRITYNSKKSGATVTANTRTFTLTPGQTGEFFVEPSEYGATSMGADRVDFTVEVLPPQTGGIPKEGKSYPTYRFAYRL